MWAVSNLQGGDLENARRRFSEVASLERPGSEAHASALLNLGELEYAAGNVEAARDAARRARASYASLNSVYTALVLSNLAAYAMEAGDLDEARANLRDALELQQKTTGDRWLASLIQHHALLGALVADHERAVPLAGFSEALYAARGEARHLPSAADTSASWRRSRRRSRRMIASRLELGARLTKQEALARALAIYGEHVRE